MAEPLRALLAGGGTAGHVNPLLATAAALRDSGAEVSVLGTAEGLEHTLVPEAGFPLELIDRVPLPRRPSLDLLRLPGRLRGAVSAADRAIAETGAQVVVGFGGYVATPAYLAARRRNVPVVVHEQNARPGLANRVGARRAAVVALTFASTPLRAGRGRTEVTGLPLRASVAELAADRATAEGAAARRAAGAAELGLEPHRTTLLVTGGSLGAQRLNDATSAAAADLVRAGAQVLHLTGRGKDGPVRAMVEAAARELPAVGEHYHVREYLGAMEHAYACTDLVLCRSGAGTVAELTALGLPAVYVPLPIGNGEQRLNAADVLDAGGGVLVDDADLDAAYVSREVAALLADPDELRRRGAAAANAGSTDAAAHLVALVREAAGTSAPGDRSEEGGRG
ncbi:UDP-N-acetylglucosamine--N-acetylmuramyl-(pentapeptide) pyrophosphoryl-undecaprenol N-acetylglucosamine transferase [Georgenia halophila]|uniref:UDP-N-acetylglucosamine--N-acetylmuramyl-(pentapeptide) pyrophosphoryl-undecaprenol N-acetylglucosamine transferase n=1 Tax=Georgenia halophila TaxID=620889 RepID=A0ABP8L7E9_9MICO